MKKRNQNLMRDGLNLMGKYESGTNRELFS